LEEPNKKVEIQSEVPFLAGHVKRGTPKIWQTEALKEIPHEIFETLVKQFP
jgi:hypothetical protein